MDYAAFKLHLQHLFETGPLGEVDSLLHVHAGMAILMIVRVVTGRHLSTVVPLACVVVAQVVNEIIDRITHGSWRWPDTIGDTINTLFWPTVIFIGLRVRNRMSGRHATGEERAEEPSV